MHMRITKRHLRFIPFTFAEFSLFLDQGVRRCRSENRNAAMILMSRFNGPDGSANGGYTCGMMSNQVAYDCVEVTLRMPPPLDVELEVRESDELLELLHQEALVATAKEGELDLELPEFPTWEEALDASSKYGGHQDHPFPKCFVCGPDRGPEDGLNIFAGPVEGKEIVAATWVPTEGLADENGLVKEEYLWCALDCPGAFAVDQKMATPRVLGRLTAQVFACPPAGEKVRVVGWPLGIERRKAFAGTALIDSQDKVCAVAKAIWIAIR